ncbi:MULTISPECIES: hypothetical protein [Leclercia]|uniref:Uncharacterized protein n=1 Tax=Leclercia pneumoniae TaxID=2815358 RepID=A0ABX8K254_9ENTR|nr:MULTISPECIES: hypothetical protein [Leclercia]KGB01481.1 hypothetical protein DR73_1112 [Enterobacteriaceae bacterium ATCC 29904]KKY88641.1 hypothetical protein OA46_08495 [Enterobacter cloacae]MBM6605139.1 hypothetical protein [Enterobacteriaceae bacterium RIT 814]MCE6964478.1 hypothetical protein [Enterobacter sp. MW07]MCV2512339.1 hypothetical protein [Leclercia pneumoniae]
MKANEKENRCTQQHLSPAMPLPALHKDDKLPPGQHDKEFIKAMNAFTAKAGLLSDDPYFGGI